MLRPKTFEIREKKIGKVLKEPEKKPKCHEI
jgi:hypothetical protein